MTLEIYTDASIHTFDNGRMFGCSGALCSTTGNSKYTITPDTTNNKSELIAIYLGVQLAHEIMMANPGKYNRIELYSDSQFGIFGITRWINGWIRNTDANGVMYGSNNQPVKNQELFAMILSYLSTNKLHVNFYHMAGHVRYTSPKMLSKANETFKSSNGFYLRPEDIYKISYYNDIVDKTSRSKLAAVNPDAYPVIVHDDSQIKYRIPKDFRRYTRGGEA